jgi:superoxide dismutase, Cu-Zn family
MVAIQAQADPLVFDMHYVTAEGTGKLIGTVTATQTRYGTLFTPQLKGLSPGLHGFHLHENGSCGPGEKEGTHVPGLGAGGHYDPNGTGTHMGPYSDGHLGDLPALYVDSYGAAEQPVLAPRIKLPDLKGRSLVIHANGDTYSDQPSKLGGGGARIGCGVIQP